MKEAYDDSNRLTIKLPGDNRRQSLAHAERLERLGGKSIEQLDDFDQTY